MLAWYDVLEANCAWEGELAEVGLASLHHATGGGRSHVLRTMDEENGR